MKRINKEKIEFLQPLRECQPMNQQNKFSPEINKHDISAGSYGDGGARCRSRKVQGAPDRKKEPPSQSGKPLAGRPLQLELCDENAQEASRTHALEQDFNTADI